MKDAQTSTRNFYRHCGIRDLRQRKIRWALGRDSKPEDARLLTAATAFLVSVLGFVLVQSVFPVYTFAQAVRPLAIEDALGVRSFGEYTPIAFSPDDRWFSYVVRGRGEGQHTKRSRRTGVPWNGLQARIYLQNVETRETRELTEQ
jgi:hypothetical protein